MIEAGPLELVAGLVGVDSMERALFHNITMIGDYLMNISIDPEMGFDPLFEFPRSSADLTLLLTAVMFFLFTVIVISMIESTSPAQRFENWSMLDMEAGEGGPSTTATKRVIAPAFTLKKLHLVATMVLEAFFMVSITLHSFMFHRPNYMAYRVLFFHPCIAALLVYFLGYESPSAPEKGKQGISTIYLGMLPPSRSTRYQAINKQGHWNTIFGMKATNRAIKFVLIVFGLVMARRSISTIAQILLLPGFFSFDGCPFCYAMRLAASITVGFIALLYCVENYEPNFLEDIIQELGGSPDKTEEAIKTYLDVENTRRMLVWNKASRAIVGYPVEDCRKQNYKYTTRLAIINKILVGASRICPCKTATESNTKHASRCQSAMDGASKAENGGNNSNSNHAASPGGDPFGQKPDAAMSREHPARSAALLFLVGLLTTGYGMGGFFVRNPPPAMLFNRDLRAYIMCLLVSILAGLLEIVAGVWACRNPVGRKSLAGAALAVSIPVLLFTGFITADW